MSTTPPYKNAVVRSATLCVSSQSLAASTNCLARPLGDTQHAILCARRPVSSSEAIPHVPVSNELLRLMRGSQSPRFAYGSRQNRLRTIAPMSNAFWTPPDKLSSQAAWALAVATAGIFAARMLLPMATTLGTRCAYHVWRSSLQATMLSQMQIYFRTDP
jgi:hypothetical protein